MPAITQLDHHVRGTFTPLHAELVTGMGCIILLYAWSMQSISSKLEDTCRACMQ